MIGLDNTLCEAYPELFKGRGKMTEMQQSRERKLTLGEQASIFRKRFVVDEYHKIQPYSKDNDNESDRKFDSFGLPDWKMPFNY